MLTYRTSGKSLKENFPWKNLYFNLYYISFFYVFRLINAIEKIIKGINTLYYPRIRKNMRNETKVSLLLSRTRFLTSATLHGFRVVMAGANQLWLTNNDVISGKIDLNKMLLSVQYAYTFVFYKHRNADWIHLS